MSDSYVIVSTGGTLTTRRNFDPKRHPGGEQRMAAQLDFLKPVAKWIGDFEAVWSVHDTGRVYTTWSAKKEMDAVVKAGESE